MTIIQIKVHHQDGISKCKIKAKFMKFKVYLIFKEIRNLKTIKLSMIPQLKEITVLLIMRNISSNIKDQIASKFKKRFNLNLYKMKK